MDNYLIERETLGQFVDELIKRKPLPVNTLEELETLREETIKLLDDQIGIAIFDRFTKEQNAEFNKLLEDGAVEEDYDDFFKKHNINVEQIITDTMKNFAAEFVKGVDNA